MSMFATNKRHYRRYKAIKIKLWRRDGLARMSLPLGSACLLPALILSEKVAWPFSLWNSWPKFEPTRERDNWATASPTNLAAHQHAGHRSPTPDLDFESTPYSASTHQFDHEITGEYFFRVAAASLTFVRNPA